MSTIQFNAATTFSGVRLRAYVTKCDGTPAVGSDISSIKYSIRDMDDNFAPVTGHTNVTIAATSLSDTTATDSETGLTYNFDYTVSATQSKPFPTESTCYCLDLQFIDPAQEPSGARLYYRT